MSQRHSSPARKKPRPAADAPAAAHIAWLIDLDTQADAYWPLDDRRVIPTGDPLPFKKLVDSTTRRLRGRFGTVSEEREAREAGVLPQDDRLVFMLRWTRSPGGKPLRPDEYDDIWRMNADEVDHMMSLPSIDYERAGRFTSRCLANRFKDHRPYALTSLSSDQVLWAAFEIRFEVPVAANLGRLAHFRNQEVLDRLVQFGGVFYTHPDDQHVICYLAAFRSAVSLKLLCMLEAALPFAFGLGAQQRFVRTSYKQDFNPQSTVSGPASGACFDPTTGARLSDDVWRCIRLANPTHLGLLELPAYTRAWSMPSVSECDAILKAFGLHSKSDWGFRDCWDGTEEPVFKTVRPDKQYGDPVRPFYGQHLTGQLYHDQLMQGREFFATARNYDESSWLCLDFDVSDNHSAARIIVDAIWLESHLCHERVETWSGHGVHPEFRFSGQGVYIEFFFDEPIPRPMLKALAERSLAVFGCERLVAADRKRFEGLTSDGFSILQDVSNLSHVVRLPGSCHYTTGGISTFRDGSLLPPSRLSSRQGLEQLLAEISPLKAETPSIDTVKQKEEEEPSVVSASTGIEFSADIAAKPLGSVPWKRLNFLMDGHLILNARQRIILVEAIVAGLLTRARGQRGPSPDPIPFWAAASVLVDQACRTAEQFYLGTRNIQSRISEVTGKPEKSRNRAASARKALVEAGYLTQTKSHLRRGEIVPGAGPCSTSEAATYRANIQKLLLLVQKAMVR